MRTDFLGLTNMPIPYVGNEPKYMTDGAAGADLECLYDELIHPGSIVLVETGTAMAIPEGCFGMVLPRSSLCNKKHLAMANSAGVIDSDYRGSIKVPYRNIGEESVVLKEGERIAQIVIIPFVRLNFERVIDLPETNRGTGGFGSTN
jgi:dUTP pyrophosphatase